MRACCPGPSPAGSRWSRGPFLGWDRYVGWGGAVIGMHTFGASAPAGDLQKKFGFTPEKVLEAARAQAKRKGA